MGSASWERNAAPRRRVLRRLSLEDGLRGIGRLGSAQERQFLFLGDAHTIGPIVFALTPPVDFCVK
jgi:hypothetical protein